jgi:hypothetical protein
MTIVRWITIVSVSIMLHVQAQAPVAAPPSSGPTMEQTVAFINESFKKEGEFDYDAGNEELVDVLHCCLVNTVKHKIKIHSQTVLLDGGKLTYFLEATKINIDETPVLDKKGNVAKGHTIDERWKNPIISEAPANQQLSIQLDSVDPRKMVVQANQFNFWKSNAPDPGQSASSIVSRPVTYSVLIQTPSIRKGEMTVVALGEFFDKDLAERVAKALIHVIVLGHKDEKPSLF